jgi:twitching motility two-component system response regulator PilH
MWQAFEQPVGRMLLTCHTILIVDDSVIERTRLKRILQAEGHRVLLADSGEQGLALACEEQPELILMDVTMPDLDGFATMRRLMDNPKTRHIPVVFVTGRHRQADMAWGRMLGARGYIVKPCTAEQILDQVAGAMQ